MQLMKIRPSPCLASMVRPTCSRVASASRSRSNCTTDLSALKTLYLYFFCFSFTNPVLKRRSETVGTMASEMWPIPPSRAATSASSAVEMSTPMPSGHDRHQFPGPEFHAEIIDAFHADSITRRVGAFSQRPQAATATFSASTRISSVRRAFSAENSGDVFTV